MNVGWGGDGGGGGVACHICIFCIAVIYSYICWPQSTHGSSYTCFHNYTAVMYRHVLNYSYTQPTRLPFFYLSPLFFPLHLSFTPANHECEFTLRQVWPLHLWGHFYYLSLFLSSTFEWVIRHFANYVNLLCYHSLVRAVNIKLEAKYEGTANSQLAQFSTKVSNIRKLSYL